MAIDPTAMATNSVKLALQILLGFREEESNFDPLFVRFRTGLGWRMRSNESDQAAMSGHNHTTLWGFGTYKKSWLALANQDF